MSLKYRTIKLDEPTIKALDKLKKDLHLQSYSRAVRVALKGLNEHQAIARLQDDVKTISANEFLNETIK